MVKEVLRIEKRKLCIEFFVFVYKIYYYGYYVVVFYFVDFVVYVFFFVEVFGVVWFDFVVSDEEWNWVVVVVYNFVWC